MQDINLNITFYGNEGGHTAFVFAADGLPTQLGDVIMSVNYTNGGVVADIRIFVWMDLEDIDAAELDDLNGLPNIPFNFGDGNGGFPHYDGGDGAGTYGYALIQPLDTAIWAQVNAGGPVNGTPWPTIDSGGDIADPDEYATFSLAEIAINATAFGFDTSALQGPCSNSFGSVMVKTRSSDSFTAELKDLVGPFNFGNVVDLQVDVADVSIDCYEGADVDLEATSNFIFDTYEWYIGVLNDGGDPTNPDDYTFDEVNAPDYVGNPYSVTASGAYLVNATLGGGFTASDIAIVSLNPGADIIIDYSTDVNVDCGNDGTAFTQWIANLKTAVTAAAIQNPVIVYTDENDQVIDLDNLVAPSNVCDGGSLTVKISVTDDCNSVVTCEPNPNETIYSSTFTLNADEEDPELTIPADADVECDSVPEVGQASATDNCDSDVTVVYDGEVRTDGACADSYTLTRT